MPDDPFIKPTADLKSLDADITDALAELRGARTIHERSPSAESQRTVELEEWRLDILLARRLATTQAEQLVTP